MSDIDWAHIARELAAPFDAADLKTKPGKGGGQLTYIDARTVAERLDQVVGPGNWHFDWIPMIMTEDAIHVVKGTLTIHGISKSDIGDSEKIEPNKGAVSDALKRASVLWGVGRYLYGIESPQAARAAAQQPRPQSAPGRAVAGGERRAPSEPTPSAPARATEEQQRQIRALVGPAGITMDEMLDKLNITSLGDLPAAKAGRVIDRLTAQGRERKARAAQVAPDPNSPVADTPRLQAVR